MRVGLIALGLSLATALTSCSVAVNASPAQQNVGSGQVCTLLLTDFTPSEVSGMHGDPTPLYQGWFLKHGCHQGDVVVAQPFFMSSFIGGFCDLNKQVVVAGDVVTCVLVSGEGRKPVA